MSHTVAISFYCPDLGVAGFWRLVRWCHDRGASEFTVSVSGRDGGEVTALWQQVNSRLTPFERGEATRWVPVLCMWEEESTQLWELSRESITVLSTIGLDVHCEIAPLSGDSPGTESEAPRAAVVHHLCLYRDGRPMFGLFEEQDAWAYVVVRFDELEAFREQNFGPEGDVHDDYFPEYFE